jgi:hypothetical protein
MKTEKNKQEKKEIEIKEVEKVISKDEKLDLDYIEWIFDKGWLRTKK